MKVDYCKKNNIPLICIYQPDVWYDKRNWDIKLKEAIERVSETDHLIQNVGSIYEQ